MLGLSIGIGPPYVLAYLIHKLLARLFDSAEDQLEVLYYEINKELFETRREYITSVGEEQELTKFIAKEKERGKDTAEFESRLAKIQQSTQALSKRLEELESELAKTYTKKQVLIARDKAARTQLGERAPGEIPSGFLLFTKVFVVLWTLLFIAVLVKTKF
jgi:septal ring factor EnvC (AmiA/AmiB activator)